MHRRMLACRFHHNQNMATLSYGNMGGYSTWARVGVLAATFTIWALAAAGILHWTLQFTSSNSAVSAPPQAVAQTESDPQLVGRMLGARAAAPATQVTLASRFSLQGVVAGGPLGGAALIAVDGKPAMPFAVGSAVAEGLVLKSTDARSVALAESRNSATVLTLEMPLLK